MKTTDKQIVGYSFATTVILIGALHLFIDTNFGILPRYLTESDIYLFFHVAVSNNVVFFYALFISIPVTLAAEAWMPADPQQPLISSGLKNDLVWLFISKLFRITVVVWYVKLLMQAGDQYFAWLRFEYLGDLSVISRFLIGILLIDFLSWLHHWVRHKIPLLWNFHAIHHSQKQLNLFTDFKIHVVEFIAAETIIFLPLFALSFEVPEVVAYSLFASFYTRFYHGNIKSNMWFLKLVLVTPQSHRIHHSRLLKHSDKNFGVIFSIWDRIFGTHLDDGSYPPTGVYDEHFPHSEGDSVKQIAKAVCRQTAYPFKQMFAPYINKK